MQRLDVEAAQARGAPGGLDTRRRDREHRLPGELDAAVREDRVVAQDRADVVDAGDVGRHDHVDDARRCAHVVEMDGAQAAVRDRRDAERGVERAARLGEVVGVRGLAGGVQRRRVVRQRRAHRRAGGGLEVGQGAARVVHRGQCVACACSTRVATAPLAPASSQSLRIRLPSARRR